MSAVLGGTGKCDASTLILEKFRSAHAILFHPALVATLNMLLAVSAHAELPSIRLDTVFPPGGRAGSEIEVTIAGAELDELAGLHSTHPGISAKFKADKKFAVQIAPDVPAGIYDVRISGALGVSNPRAFVVGDLPEVVKAAPHDKPETALELTIDSVANGVATAAATDYFRFAAKQGQRLIFDCAAAGLDSRFTPVLTVLDATGRELAANRGVLAFTALADATYLLRLHDLTFAGGPDYFYRLTVTSGPSLDFILPPSGARGTKSRFTLFGRNLPGGVPSMEMDIDLPAHGDARVDGLSRPAAAAIDGLSFRLNRSNPLFIGFSEAPPIVEQEANEAQKIAPPCEIAGQFFPANDTDAFIFDAKKGEVYWLEILSQRLDLPTSPFLLVRRENADVQESYGADASIGGKRFGTAHSDPAWRFEVKDDGTYRVEVRDLFGTTRSDPRSVYRLAIRRESPDFHLLTIVEPPPVKDDDRAAAPRGATIRRGGTIAIKVLAFRRDNFAGDIVLTADDLPAGVTCSTTSILAGRNDGLLLLTATEDATPWVGAIRIRGRHQELVREARGGVVRWPVADSNENPVPTRLTRDFALAVVSDQAPMSVASAEDKTWEIAAGGKLEIPLTIARRGEFKDALKLKAFGAPGLETFKELEIAGSATTAAATLDLAALKLPAGTHTIYFHGQTKGKFRGKDVIAPIYTPPIRIIVNAPEKT